MELLAALRTTGAIREFTPEPVPDATVAGILDNARFAPSGGNRQGWRVIVLRDAKVRRQIRDLYIEPWYEYLAMRAAGLTPWAPITDREAEREALTHAPEIAAQAAAGPGGFAEHLDDVPVLLLVLADLRALAAVDRDLAGERYTFAGGASIYPFAWNVLLAAREQGLGGVITTMPIQREAAVKALLDIPDEFAVAGLIALGHPVHQPRKLTRNPVDAFTTVDRYTGESFP